MAEAKKKEKTERERERDDCRGLKDLASDCRRDRKRGILSKFEISISN